MKSGEYLFPVNFRLLGMPKLIRIGESCTAATTGSLAQALNEIRQIQAFSKSVVLATGLLPKRCNDRNNKTQQDFRRSTIAHSGIG